MNNSILSRLRIKISSIFLLLFGQLRWNCPPWLIYLQKKAKSKPKQFLGATAFSLLLLAALGYGYHWYKNLPKPQLVEASITAPKPTPLADRLVPENLTINFGIRQSPNNFVDQSVAPLNLIGKNLISGVQLLPKIPGKWTWLSDSNLVFTPEQDWPAGQVYSIHFAKDFFAANTKMATYDYQFSTASFSAKVDEFKLYQDPLNPKIRQAVATLSFNFPVDKSSLEANTSLTLEALKTNADAKKYQFTIDYDPHQRKAYLHSENLTLPEVSRYLNLRISKGVKAAVGSTRLTSHLNQNLLIPNSANFLKISSAQASIIRNDKDKPEQILTIESSLGIAEPAINKALEVFVLPKNYPATANEAEKTDYEWQNPGEVSAAILALAKPLSLQALPSDRNYANLHSYKFNAETPQFLYLKIKKGMPGFGGFILSEDFRAIIKVPEFPREISFIHKGSLLALSAEKKLSVLIRGLDAVKFNFARILPEDVNQLVTQTQGDFNSPYFINSSFNQQNISEIFSEMRQFNTTSLNQEQYTALDFGKYLSTASNSGGPQGLFLLQATGWDKEKNEPLNATANRLILITDLGLIVKDNANGSHSVFVQSITQGTPVANATVSVLGKNGLPVLTAKTDFQGLATFPTLKDFIEDREPTAYLASLGSDVSFIPYNRGDRQLNYSRYDIGGLYTANQEAKALRAYLFSDRGIYRPGDTVHLGMIVKQAFAKPQSAGLPLEAIVYDPRGTMIKDQKLTLDSSGYLSLDFETNASSPTGQYLVYLYIVKDSRRDNLIGSTEIRLAEFQPDRMRISANFSQSQNQGQGWISPVDLKAKVELWNLYGAWAADRRVAAKIILSPKSVQFPQFPDFTFVDPLLDPDKPAKVFTDNLKDATTDAKGQAEFDLDLKRFEGASYHLTFFAEGFEADGGRSVATQATALVSPLPYFIGYKADGDLSYIRQNSPFAVNFIAVNPQLKQLKLSDLKIQLISLHPVTTLVKKSDGTYQYQSIIQSKVIESKPFIIDEQGTNFNLATQQIGDFAIKVLDKDNKELSQFKYTVVGASQQPLAKNAQLTIKLNKSEYKAGEDIELQITAPYTGGGLITIERDKVYATQWFKSDSPNSMQKIHIPEDLEGNAYVNVSFVRNWDSPELFISPLSYAIAPFALNHDNQRLQIDLQTPELARPGEAFKIDYKTDKPAKIIVFAVDEGILQVSNYKTPDPLAFFFQKQALEVITQQTVDLILPKFIQDRELSAVGGDGSEEQLANHLNPFKRKTDLPVVYWSGIVDADSTSKSLTYQLPSYFNGSLRVMAVAVAADAMGAAEKHSEVRGYFVINPNTPTFVAPNDEFEISASIANNIKGSGENVPVSVQLTSTDGLEIIGSARNSLKINEGQEKTVHFKLRATSNLGSANLGLEASYADKSSSMDASLSIRPANAFTTTITSGSTKDSQKQLPVLTSLYPEYRKVEAAISTSPLILVAGLEHFLEGFPYGCTEQLTSKAWPLLAMAGQSWFANDKQEINDKISTTIQMLGQRQMSNGGLSYWPGSGDNPANTFSTVYAMHFLTEARSQNFNVPTDLFSAGLGFLRDLAAQTPTNKENARIQAYAIYVLTRNEIVTSNYLTHLQNYLESDKDSKWQEDITGAYLAATYQLLQSSAEANNIISKYKLQENRSQSNINATNDFYNSAIADAQYLYLIARHFPERLDSVGDKLVLSLAEAINESELNTVLAGFSSIALEAYAKTNVAPVNSSLAISEIAADNKEKTLTALDNNYEKVNVDEGVKRLIFKNPTQQRIFFQLSQAGFNKELPTEALKQGIEIDREYRDKNGNSIKSTILGTEIEVHIQLRALDSPYLSNIAIVDLLPGGFEVVRDSVKTETVEYVDIREDRVVFFLSLDNRSKEIVYRIKAINTGNFTSPAIFAESMYNPKLRANSSVGSIEVKSPSAQ